MSSSQRPSMSDASQRTSSMDSTNESIRKRVCKACDRCRLKKSKCDGATPCSRCKADNAICVFGERKKSHDKVYPKGYVEMLEQQQRQLVSGLQEMYRRLLAGQSWSGPTLSEEAGHPLTHDILAALELLETKADGSGEMEAFEDDVEKLQSRLFKAGAPSIRRKGSMSSESEHSGHARSTSTAHTTPITSKAGVFKEAFAFSPSPSPLAQSPAPRQRQSQHPPPTSQQTLLHQATSFPHDPQFYQAEWTLNNNAEAMLRSKYALQAPSMQQGFPDDVTDLIGNEQSWVDLSDERFDSPVDGFTSFPTQFANSYSMPNFSDFNGASIDPMDLEFNRYIQVST